MLCSMQGDAWNLDDLVKDLCAVKTLRGKPKLLIAQTNKGYLSHTPGGVHGAGKDARTLRRWRQNTCTSLYSLKIPCQRQMSSHYVKV